ncbi:Calcium load-activated calcium channel [Chionoecetes opilio]|uniref:Calcium load-activated calcium channel n=1 Tax=Chionoecetes opilio TaxID=41210 RepID=A0A8J4XSZ7_CHIOP|nr:Calcium load-activated calcium channel [Chionoecetes opilio]
MWADTLFIVFISICTALFGEGLTWLLVYRTEKYQKLKAEVERQCKRLEKKKEAHGDSIDRQQKRKIEREEERLKNSNRDLSLVKMKSMFAIGFAFTALLSMFNSIINQVCRSEEESQAKDLIQEESPIEEAQEAKEEESPAADARRRKRERQRPQALDSLVYCYIPAEYCQILLGEGACVLAALQEQYLVHIRIDGCSGNATIRDKERGVNSCFEDINKMISAWQCFDGRVVAKLPFVPISWLQGLSHRNLMGDDYTDCSFIFLYILCTMSIRQNIQKLLGFAPSRAANKHSTNLFGPQPQQLSGYK